MNSAYPEENGEKPIISPSPAVDGTEKRPTGQIPVTDTYGRKLLAALGREGEAYGN
jgi:hypothetical protein